MSLWVSSRCAGVLPQFKDMLAMVIGDYKLSVGMDERMCVILNSKREPNTDKEPG